MSEATSPQVTRMVRNSLFSVLRFLVLLPLPLLVVPFMLGKLGDERFGVWAIVALFTSYTQLADFGMGLALTKYVAEFAAQKQWQRLDMALNTVFFFYLVVGLSLATLVLLGRHFLAGLVPQISPALTQEIATVIGIAALTFAVNLTLGAFNSTLQGLQRMDLTNLTALANGIGLYLGIVVVLALGGGLVGMAVLSLVLAVASGAFNGVMTQRLAPGLRLRWRTFDAGYLRSVLSYSLNIQGGALTELLFDPLSKLVITRFLGVALVTQYEVGQRIITQLRGLFAVAFLPLFPGVSHLHAEREQQAVQMIYQRSSRYVYLLGWPAYLLLIITAPWLLTAWLGQGYAQAAFVMRLMTCGWFVSLVAFPPYMILQALGQAHLCLRAHVVQGFTNLVLALLLVGPFGFVGITVAAFVALVIGSSLVLVAFAQTLQLSGAALARLVPWRAVGLALGSGAALALVLTRLPQVTLLTLAALAAAYAAVYAGLLLAQGVVSQSDRRLIRSLWPARRGL
ncbi:MAG: oligosaccharide flippase family protein [Anaerolineae bacterium]